MAKKVRFELDIPAFGEEVLKAEYMRRAVDEVAKQIQARAGDGYVASSTIGRKRALAMVYTDTPEAMRDNNQNNTLLKALK